MKNIQSLHSVYLILLAAFLLSACSNSKNEVLKGYATFDYIEYKGYDPVYDDLELSDSKYLNPILSGFYPDPSMVRVEDDYYLVSSTFSFFPGIPIFHSKDLVNWTQIGHVLDRFSQVSFDSLNISDGVFAPAISYYQGVFYVVNTIVHGIGNFVVKATDPAGPWSDPFILPFGGFDPSLFFDDDGKAYLVHNDEPDVKPLYSGHKAIWIQEFDKDKMQMKGPRKVMVNGGVNISENPIWIEGPHLFKHKGFYYLSAAEGGTAEGHSQVIFRSKNVWGPYIPWKGNPILTQRHLNPNRDNPVSCTGHMDMLETQNGEWWAVFLGCTPYQGNHYNTGRQTFLLPVKWKNGWPVVLEGCETVPYIHPKPELPAQETGQVPLNGNFSLRDNFNDSALSLIYNYIRVPKRKWYSLQNGLLIIEARNVTLNEKSQPSFIGRRQQHHYCETSTSLVFNPVNIGDKAGLSIFQNEAHYYLIAVTKKENGTFITLEKGSVDGPVEIRATAMESNIKDIRFKIEARGDVYNFYYASSTEEWQTLAMNIDARLLSTLVAKGFVGSYFGLYAYLSQ